MPPRIGATQDRARAMDDDELRAAYLKLFMKYSDKGIVMMHPETLPIFSNKPAIRKKHGRRKLHHSGINRAQRHNGIKMMENDINFPEYVTNLPEIEISFPKS